MSTQSLIAELVAVVGAPFVITDPSKAEAYCSGYRFGSGKAVAVARPASLLEYWQALNVCVAHDAIVISQAANTGLTGGSTPNGEYDRPVVLINAMRIDGIHLINNAEQVVCLPGSTLNALEKQLKPHGREPHSVIGSSCIGASVIGGVCNNSGGALVQRGPAYTEMALFAQLDENGQLQLKNHLGIYLGDTPEAILTNLQNQNYTPKDIIQNYAKGHDHRYCHSVRQVDENSPARFNADPARHYEASGSAGKLAIFAVRLDTFALEKNTAVFYIGANQTQVLSDIRRRMLKDFKNLPISGEYIHKDAFDIAAVYGKDTYWVIKKLGTEYLPTLFALKAKVDRAAKKLPFLPKNLSDKCLQLFSKLLPAHLPKIFWEYRDKYEHHLIVKMGGEGIQEARDYLKSYFENSERGGYFECDAEQSQAAMLHRFAVASAAVRYRAIHENEVEDIVALDIALRRNDNEWFEVLPDEINDKIRHKLYYGHFMCHVFHQDYIVKKGNDCLQLEHQMWQLLDARGAQYPAEHNVGHLYIAKPELKNFYQNLDPTNSFNPGIGQTSKKKYWE